MENLKINIFIICSQNTVQAKANDKLKMRNLCSGCKLLFMMAFGIFQRKNSHLGRVWPVIFIFVFLQCRNRYFDHCDLPIINKFLKAFNDKRFSVL
jgi:hypothetical protein